MRGGAELLGTWGRGSVAELAAALGLSGEAGAASARRALRTLEARGVVASLGHDAQGGRVYCLAADRAALLAPWAEGSEYAALTAGGLAPAYMRPRLARFWNSSRLPLTDAQVSARRAAGVF